MRKMERSGWCSPGSCRVSIGSPFAWDGCDGPGAYTITAPIGARLDESWISSDSPMAKALLGHRVGDTGEVRAPSGMTH